MAHIWAKTLGEEGTYFDSAQLAVPASLSGFCMGFPLADITSRRGNGGSHSLVCLLLSETSFVVRVSVCLGPGP